MKRILLFLFAVVLIAGCNSNDSNENDNENNVGNDSQTEENNNENNNKSESENKDVYQIGETAQIKTAQGGYPYELTVNDFKLAKEYDGKPIRDFFLWRRSD